MSLTAGTTVGDYRVVKKLGEGGMGEVYLAVHQTLGQKVVLKGLHEQYWRDRELGDRLEREAQAMARLSHPNIVTIYNFIHTPDGAHIVMEYVDGTSFDDLIRRTGRIQPGRAIELLVPALRALEYAHGHGVIHRDLKPANLMLGHEGQVRVLDFGTAKLVDQPGLTRIGTTLGTATYMPPEQLMGQTLTPAADIYAIGVTLYEMCTGRLPFESEDTRELYMKILHEAPAPPRVYDPAIPRALEAAILRCLAKRPEDRYATAAELAAELAKVATPAPAPPLEPVPPPATLPRAAAGARFGVACSAAGLAGVVAGSGLIFLGYVAGGAVAVWTAAPLWAVGTAVLGVIALTGTGPQAVAAPPPIMHLAPAATRLHGSVDAPTMGSLPAVPARDDVWRHAPFDPGLVADEAGATPRREPNATTIASRSEIRRAVGGRAG